MTVYFLLLLICSLGGFIHELKKSKYWYIFVISLSIIILCGGYMTGSDWRLYELFYEELNLSSPFESFSFEPGYVLYMCLFKILGISFWPYFIITKAIIFLVCVHFIKKYSGDKFYLCYTYFVFSFGIFFFVDNPMRNLIAATIMLFAIEKLISKNYWQYIFIVIIASLFHVSAILMLIIPVLFSFRINNWGLFTIFILLNIASVTLLSHFLGAVEFLSSLFSYLEGKFTSYFVKSGEETFGRLFSLGFIIQFLFFLLLLYSRKYLEAQGNTGKLIFSFGILYVFFYRLGLSIDLFYRFQMYLSLFYTIAIVNIQGIFKVGINRTSYSIYLMSLLLMFTYTTITSSPKYVPYTNYFVYSIFYDDLDYNYRSDYNYKFSPYKNEE